MYIAFVNTRTLLEVRTVVQPVLCLKYNWVQPLYRCRACTSTKSVFFLSVCCFRDYQPLTNQNTTIYRNKTHYKTFCFIPLGSIFTGKRQTNVCFNANRRFVCPLPFLSATTTTWCLLCVLYEHRMQTYIS